MGNAMHVLWIDPDYSTIAACRKALERQGLEIDYAPTAAQALEMAKRSAYDLAIIDLVLPDTLGTEAWGLLCKRNQQMVAIMTTGVPTLHRNVNARGKRVLAYLLKPLSSRAILRALTRGEREVPGHLLARATI